MDGALTLILLLGICFGMHFFMHRGHGNRHDHGSGHGHGTDRGDRTQDALGSADGREEPEPHERHAGRGCH